MSDASFGDLFFWLLLLPVARSRSSRPPPAPNVANNPFVLNLPPDVSPLSAPRPFSSPPVSRSTCLAS